MPSLLPNLVTLRGVVSAILDAWVTSVSVPSGAAGTASHIDVPMLVTTTINGGATVLDYGIQRTDGDGIAASTIADGVYFDWDNDGLGNASAWAEAEDGFLVRDLNGGGRITEAAEMFGNSTTNGFDMLAALDENQDGWINSYDSGWADLQLWIDGNSDGITDAGELVSLDTYSIVSLSLNYNQINQTINGGSNLYRTATFNTWNAVDGSRSGTMGSLWFAWDEMNSRTTGSFNLDMRSLFLPTLRDHANDNKAFLKYVA